LEGLTELKKPEKAIFSQSCEDIMIKYGFVKQGKGLNQGDELARGVRDAKTAPN